MTNTTIPASGPRRLVRPSAASLDLARLRNENAVLRAAYARALARDPREPVTGLFRASGFEERLEQELARSQRFWSPLGLLLFEVDDLKVIGDTAGGATLRRLLETAGRALGRLAREVDVPFRLDGGAFAVILPCTNRTGVEAEERRLRDLVEHALAVTVPRLPTSGRATLSAGFAVAPDDVQTASELSLAAIEALVCDRHRRLGRDRPTEPAPPLVAA
jgi:diguanylate cyclase (GGDEF)-like protein